MRRRLLRQFTVAQYERHGTEHLKSKKVSMANNLYIMKEYNDVLPLFKFLDPRTKDHFLIGSPIPGICLLVFYNYFVNHLGPRLMEDRKPFKLDRFMIYYNIIQIVSCLYLFVEVRSIVLSTHKSRYSISHQKLNFWRFSRSLFRVKNKERE